MKNKVSISSQKLFMKKITLALFIISLMLIEVISFSQLDTKHYFPALFAKEDFGSHELVLSTHSNIPFDVTVTDGSGNLITTLTISDASSTSYTFGSGTTSPLLVTEPQLNSPMTGKGLILEGTYPFYATIRVYADPQATAMTSKGQKAALGTDFRTGHLYQNTGYINGKSNTFGIMATEDNTTITIDDIRPGVIFRGTTPSGSPLTSPSVTVTLDAGETYVVAAFLNEAGALENVNGVNGTHITSDKPIAVTTGSWLGGNPIVSGSPAAGRDIGTDQIVPIDVIGNEYVLIKGEGIDNEKVIVVAAYDNTDLMINGNPAPIATLNEGDYYVIDGSEFSTFDNLYLEASNDVYVYQSTNGGNGMTDDNERQNDLIFMPPVGCTGSKNVVLPDVNWIGTAYINIIANAGANVYVNGIPLGVGDAVTGTGDYVTYKLTSGYTGDVVITSDDLIRVALINLSGNIGAACYFSGFTKDVVVQTQTVNGNNIALEGCIPASFTFSLESPADEPTTINYTVAGTANNGVDYSHIDNSVTIPTGQISATIVINSISDGIPEGQESIYIIYQPDACSPVDTAFLFIDDAQPIQFTIDGTNLDCYEDNSGEILVNATGGFPNYTYHVTTNGGTGVTTQYTTNPITGLEAGTYSVQVYDIYGCKAEALVVGGVFDADTTFLPDGTGVSYTTSINISGFGSGEILDDMSQLQQICANMEHSYLGDLQIKIISPSGQEVILKQFPGGGSTDLGEPFASGPVDGANSDLTDPGAGYEYCWNTAPVFGTMVAESGTYTHTIPASTGGTYTDSYLPQGSYASFENLDGLLGSTLDGTWTLEITDNYALDNGYIFNWNISLMSDLPDTLVTLTEPEEIELDGFVTQAQCGGNDGAINLTVTGDYPPYTFAWSNGATTEDLTAISAGTYEVFVTDANGCVDSAEFILNNISSLNITSSVTNVNCSGGNNGAISVNTSGGTAPYNFSWSNGASTEDINTLTAGTYTLTITDDEGCIFNEDIIVATQPSMNIAVNQLNNEACGTSNGSIDISLTGGSGSYGYSWSNGQLSQDISGLTSGSYEVTVTDGFGCTVDQTFTIINDVTNCSSYCYTDVVVNSITDEICGNETGTIDISVVNATLPYEIEWSTGATTEDISSLSAGTYTVTITDANQCEHTENITVNNNTSGLSITSSFVSDENCGNSDGEINISVSGGTLPYAYQWSNGFTTQDVSNLSEGSYSVTIIDGNGCSFMENFVIENNTGTLDYSVIVSDEYCNNNNGSINLTVTGASGTLTYAWSNGATSQDLTGLNPGNFSCTITDQSGCALVTDVITVGNNPGSLEIYATNIINENCGDGLGEIDINLLGGATPYSYSWSNGATSQDISGLSAGDYSCIVTDDNGCSVSTGTLTVWNAPGNLELIVSAVNDEQCGNGQGSIFIETVGGTAPFSYIWSDGSTDEDNLMLSAGNYMLTVNDALGCTYFINETIENISGTLSIDLEIVTDESCGNSNGAINLTVSGGTLPYTYVWSSGQTTQDITSLSEGVYSVSIEDATGCIVGSDIEVENNTGSLNYSHLATAEICNDNNGSIDLTVSGGSTPYNFSWSNGATTEDLSTLSAGTYSCSITDNAGCTIQTIDIVIGNNPGSLSVITSATNETCNLSNGSIDLTVTGGSGSYTYLWSNATTTQDISLINEGSYSYTVTDGAGCEVNGNVDIVNTSGSLTISYLSSDEYCNDNSGSVDVTVVGGALPISYVWSNAATTEDISSLSEGNFSLTVSDNNGCEVTLNDIVIANNSGTLNLESISVTDENCSNGIGSIDLEVTGGTLPYNYSWNTGATSQDVLLLSEGNYAVTVTDASGCSFEVFATVENNPGNLQIFSQTISNESCNTDNGAIDITVAGGTPGYTYLWSNGSTSQDISSLSEGVYSVLISDAGSCELTADFNIVNAGGNLSISGVTIADEICNNGEGAININISDGTAPFNFLWSNGSISEDLNNVNTGDYTINITDFNGCSYNETFNVGNNNGSLEITSIIVSDENCGDASGAIDLSVSGGSAPLSYSWSNGSSTQDITGLVAGNYSVIVEDNFGCTVSTAETVVNLTAGFVANVASFNDENCGDAAGFIDVDVSGGTSPYTYSWSNGATVEDISGLQEGLYELTVTDANGCSIIVSQAIQNNTGTLAVTDVVQNANCVTPSGFIDLSITGGTPGYTFDWSNGATTEDIAGLSAGTYSCVITDNAGCVINYSVDITNGGGSMSIVSVVEDAVCGNNNGSIEVTVSGGINPYTFDWTGASPNPCCEYTVDMDDSFGDGWNGGILEVWVNGSNAGTFSAAGFGSVETFGICDGDNIEFIYTAGAWEEENSYSIFDSQNNLLFADGPNPTAGLVYTTTAVCTAGAPNVSIVSNLAPGNYSVTITDDVGCEVTENFTIDAVDSDLQLNLTSLTDDVCSQNNGQIVYTISGGEAPYDPTLNGDPDLFTIGQFSFLAAGDYELVVWDAQGCTDTMQLVIDNQTTFTLDVIQVQDENCGQSDGFIDLDISAGADISWSNGATTEDIFDLSAGVYTVTVTTTAPFCQDEQTFEIFNSGDITSTAIVTNENCNDGAGAIDLTVSGSTNLSFDWSNGATTEDISGLSAGNYTCLITNIDSGCELTESFDIVNITTGVDVIGFANDDFCGNGNGGVDITVTGGSGFYSYDWSDGSSNEDLTNVGQGDYSVVVTDLSDGCEITFTATVGNFTTFDVTADITDAACATCTEGVIDITVNEFFPDGPYTFEWSNGETTEDISGLTPGLYTVIVTSGSGCSTELTFEVGNSNSVGMVESEGLSVGVYPNPARETATIVYRSELGNDIIIYVTNSLGEIIFVEEINSSSGSYVLDVTNLARGIYFIHVNNGNVISTMQLIVANK